MTTNNTSTTTTKTPERTGKGSFNTTITAMFENAKFGQLSEGVGALLSTPLKPDAFDAVHKHLQIGSRLVIKRGKRPASNGSAVFFLEILPPLTEEQNKTWAAKKANSSKNTATEDDI